MKPQICLKINSNDYLYRPSLTPAQIIASERSRTVPRNYFSFHRCKKSKLVLAVGGH